MSDLTPAQEQLLQRIRSLDRYVQSGDIEGWLKAQAEIIYDIDSTVNGECRYFYAITLTTTEGDTKTDLEKRLHNLYTSKTTGSIEFTYCIEHEDTNIHAHVLLGTNRYIKAQHVLRVNENRRVDVKLIKGLAITKWRHYMNKENASVKLC